jgi:plastocyanin
VHTSTRTTAAAISAAIIAAMAASCGSQTPTSPAGDDALIWTVMLESTGLNPREITIDVGDTVSFMNHESVPYAIAGGAAPSQSACPEINAVGVLGPGEIRSTTPFSVAKTCDYHVPNGQTVLFSGRIVVR